MTPETQEHTRLLDTPGLTAPDVPIAAQNNDDATLLHTRDAKHDPDDIQDHPLTSSLRAVKSHLMTEVALEPGTSSCMSLRLRRRSCCVCNRQSITGTQRLVSSTLHIARCTIRPGESLHRTARYPADMQRYARFL